MGDHNTDGIDIVVADRIAMITLNRPPDRGNSITVSGTAVLAEIIDQLGRDDEVRVIVITGTGRFFSTGLDIKDAATNPEAAKQLAALPAGGTQRILHDVILECPTPTIAAINGAAIGGGLEIALACDLRVAVTGAILGLPEAQRGMGAVFASNLLHRVIPRALAFELLYTGEPITAETAKNWGLLNRVVEPERLEAAVADLAHRISRNAPLTIRRIKSAVTAGETLPISAAMRLDIGPNPYSSRDRIEGLSAWNEKREPRWTGS